MARPAHTGLHGETGLASGRLTLACDCWWGSAAQQLVVAVTPPRVGSGTHSCLHCATAEPLSVLVLQDRDNPNPIVSSIELQPFALLAPSIRVRAAAGMQAPIWMQLHC